MRSIWKGAITFGLVNVPVKVYSATEDHDISLHQVHDKDGGRIRYQRRCEVCGKIVDYENIDKAYDDGERTVVLTDEELKSLPEERSREINVLEFVPTEQIDPIMFNRSYYLEPDSKSSKAYVLLRRTLEETDRTAIVHFALRQKTRLAALRVRGDVLMIQTLLWDDEVREAAFPSLDEKVRIQPQELKMSASLVESFEADFEPEKYTDDYQVQLRELIDAKLKEGDALDTDATFGKTDEDEGGGEVLDLMEALRRSVEKSRGGGAKGKGKSSASDGESDKAPTKSAKAAATKSAPKAAAKKSDATKPAAKKAPAKKTSANKASTKSDKQPAKSRKSA
jgi:DNA end-binding protein Ku